MLRLSTTIAMLAAAGLLACPPSTIPDTDNNPAAVDLPRLPPDLEVMDSLDVKGGDLVDWKTFTAFDSGKGTITAIVGDPFGGPHGLVGEIGVYARSGPPAIRRMAITPTEHNYTLEFEVTADETYLLQVSAEKGKAPYRLTFGVTVPPRDPCEDVECGDEEECIDGKCIAPEPPDDVCSPKCPRGRVCVAGKCELPCGGSCPRGMICSIARNTCVKDPCFEKKCASGETCRGGRCIPPARPVGCSPACAADEECKGSTCVKKATAATPDPPAGGPVPGKIIQLIPRGAKTELVLDRGSKHGVSNGATGRIDGVAGQFKIIEVYTFRSKAVIGVDDKTIGTARSVTINR